MGTIKLVYSLYPFRLKLSSKKAKLKNLPFGNKPKSRLTPFELM